jgi:hypothetical protein
MATTIAMLPAEILKIIWNYLSWYREQATLAVAVARPVARAKRHACAGLA